MPVAPGSFADRTRCLDRTPRPKQKNDVDVSRDERGN
ncbi:hypothetical protein ETAA1_09300 [Urbifossiella limnaea]|uniref:Uncharacterized protein n=1 Tax=Urbifossiella limnaea TaxID=2528023 RepID=A0A517XNE3_9BACT|nr:hypothetical protein ETAA1_09300 [Urbifossiella limnaea]